MWQGLVVSGVAVSLLTWVANGLYLPPHIANDSLLDSYDYIVVGGGPSGLVVANRLSEDASVTVLLLEAGTLDTEDYTIMVPAEIGEDLGTDYDWQHQTTEQEFLDSHTVRLNQGKVVGGGTILNGMVWTRSSARDYDVWQDLNSNQSLEATKYSWRWADLLPYFQKSESFSAPVDGPASEALHIQPDAAVHGDSGYVQVGFSHFFYEQYANFLNGMKQMGLQILSEPNNGTMDGAFVAPSSLAALNQSRSDGRVAYLDPVLDRSNLHVASEQMVMRILLEQGRANSTTPNNLQTAVGVQIASGAGYRNISCTKEVILAAGAIFSPTLLQISGVGPQDVLESLDIPVIVDLPGVGANLMDHGMIHPIYKYTNTSLLTSSIVKSNADSHDAALDEYYTNRTGPLTAPMISTVAFPSMRYFADDWVKLLQNATQPSVNAIPANTDPTVRLGYLAQRAQQLTLLRDPSEGAVEILADSIGELSLAMMRPLSRGTVRPRSASIFDLPVVDPRYCADPFDCLVLARALLFNCALIETPEMAVLEPVVQAPYFCPSANDTDRETTDARMLALVKQKLVTEFHPSGTTAMLPLELGGVVDTDLKVYGTNNLRVVDAGVMPVIIGAHLQAVVYAVAEKAADIIKEVKGNGQVSGPLGASRMHRV